LLFVGSPTQGGRPLKTTQAFIEGLSDSALKGLKTGVFDTRMTGNIPKLFGWAAKRMADALKKKGAVILLNPDGFFVKGSKGPVVDGELERATAWGKSLKFPCVQLKLNQNLSYRSSLESAGSKLVIYYYVTARAKRLGCFVSDTTCP
jgi:hypothetical protein